MTGKVRRESLSRNTFVKQGSGYKPERRGVWKTLKGLVSMHEIKEAASQGACLSGING